MKELLLLPKALQRTLEADCLPLETASPTAVRTAATPQIEADKCPCGAPLDLTGVAVLADPAREVERGAAPTCGLPAHEAGAAKSRIGARINDKSKHTAARGSTLWLIAVI